MARANHRYIGVATMVIALAVTGCKPGVPQGPEATVAGAEAAPWLNQLIRELKGEKPANPPARVYRYIYNGREVYYLTGRCCDVPSRLYDADGKVLCEPDGGITGKGDGRCADFYERRSGETLVWEDKRES